MVRGYSEKLDPVTTSPLVSVELTGEYEIGVFGDKDGKDAVDGHPPMQRP